MEGRSSTETRQVLRPPKQHGQAPVPPERPEATHSPHAVLESKVKALKEKRGAGRLGTPTAAPERPSPKKSRPRRGKPGGDLDAAEPRAQLRTYLTDGMLDGGDPAAPPAPRAGTPGLWRVPTPKGDVPEGTELPHDKSGGTQRSASPHEAPPLEEEARTPLRDRRGPSGSPPTTEGWESLSLAERVERNRRLLQEVLGTTTSEVSASDGDWDSGVSLQDAEGSRAFVPGQELELSPRHEQAKQLLQRARMKARTNPLRASHDILLLPSAAAPPSREPSGRPSVAPRDGGSLSDSSSGESSCGRLRRPRGPSPSRVRFEDESARDAERIHTEKIKETYIGDVTYIDEVDSALESTDTSDGCRTDRTPSQPVAGPVILATQEAAHPPGEAAGTPRAQQQQQQQRPPAGSTDSGELGRPASRKGSSASASGLKKLLSSLSQSTKQRLGRFRCYSMEQLPAPPGAAPPDGPGMKKSPSLQSLTLVSPFCQPQKATSTQSLHPALGKGPRASAYLLPQPAPDRTGGSGPRRSLSVEDIGAPGRLRAVGRVVEVFPDGTSQLELQRPPHGAFGFRVTSGHGRPDTGVYVQEMADAGTAKLYAGLLGVGDEILQVNGVAVSGLGLARIRDLLLRADTLSLRVLRHRPPPR
ncbi:Kiaa1614 [Columba guinea]|nr:Kiaa1614 [Columba guinea]